VASRASDGWAARDATDTVTRRHLEGYPARVLPPRALFVTIYGLYARDRGGALGISGLVRLLSALDVDEPAARSLVSRLKQRGLLRPVTVSGAAGYGLTDDGRRLLDEGDRRIYGRPRALLSDGWLLAVFSVPETERAQRHSLRARLAALGFGTVSAGVWIAPSHLAAETRDVLRHHRLDRYVELFTGAAHDGDPAAAGAAVSQWWDLAALAQLYRTFADEQRPVLARWHGRSGVRGAGGDGMADGAADEVPAPGTSGDDGAAAFADYVRAVTAWRRLPYRDPGLPAEVLPAGWPGETASQLFAGLREALAARAARFAATVENG
jgi:phenylacetic acid degradation operon negative regulatory protein